MIKAKLHTKWYLPTRGFHRFCAVICTSRHFEIFIYLVIVCNVVVLAMPYNGMSSDYGNRLEQLTFAFNVIYNIEAFIKLAGLRLRYFYDKWNIMDFLIVVASDVGIILALYSDYQVSTLIQVIRALRVMRMLKLVKGSVGLKVLIEAITVLFVNLINILGLLLLLIFMFSILGMNIFHGAIYRENYNEHTNFRSFDNSLMLLLRCVTGEGWNLIMLDLGSSSAYNGV